MSNQKYPCLITKKISELTPARYNPRKISSDALGRLTKSLSELGNLQPITWNAKTGNIVGGHQRLKCYQALQKDEVEVWAVWLDEAQEKAANIALNKLSGEFDLPSLKDILEELDTGEIDLDITGFGADELADLMEQTKPEVEEDEVPEVPVEAITKPGDLWLLGEHRLLCGDSTKEEDVARLMNGEKADMVFTDPPYGVDYDGGMKKREKLKDDHLGTDVYDKVLPICVSNTIDRAAFYIWYADGHIAASASASAGIHISAQIIWVKNHAQFMSNARYKGKHEPCMYGYKKSKGADWFGPNNEVTVWEYDRSSKNEFHPTQKPVQLSVRAINNSCKSDGIVLDLFLGSGATLIGAEQTKRKCYGMEISPNYCDVIVKRWENLTGKKAVLAK